MSPASDGTCVDLSTVATRSRHGSDGIGRRANDERRAADGVELRVVAEVLVEHGIGQLVDAVVAPRQRRRRRLATPLAEQRLRQNASAAAAAAAAVKTKSQPVTRR